MIYFKDYGTFKCSPNPFPQYFTIHVFIGLRLMPALHCLLSHKTEDIYKKVFDWIVSEAQGLELQINTTAAMCDFETALPNAVRVTLNLNVTGCFFHANNENDIRIIENGGLLKVRSKAIQKRQTFLTRMKGWYVTGELNAEAYNMNVSNKI